MHNKAMTTSVTDDRARFEKWVRAETELDLERREDGEYAFGGAQDAWSGYQAALRSQGKVDDVSEIRGLRTGLALGWRLGQENDSATFNKTMAAYDREAREMRKDNRLTAIIGEGD